MNNNNAINREVEPEAAPNGSATPPAFTSKESGQNINQKCVSNTPHCRMRYSRIYSLAFPRFSLVSIGRIVLGYVLLFHIQR